MSKNRKLTWDIIIVGAGAAGMMAGIVSAKAGKKVLLLEQCDKPGKKILATGNGKCNFTNAYMERNCFHGDKELIETVLSTFTQEDCVSFFHSIGIFPKEKNGYFYPNSEQAASVVYALTEELKRLNAKLLCSVIVENIKKENDMFSIITNEGIHLGKKLILATGLLAAPKLGSNGSLFGAMKALGHHFSPIVPALCGFYCNGLPFKKISGVRVTGTVTAFVEDQKVASDTGEIQLTDYGISGIPVFQISRYLSLGLYEKKSVKVLIDFIPQMSNEELMRELVFRRNHNKTQTLEATLNGLLNKKLSEVLLDSAGLKSDLPIHALSDKDLWRLILAIKETKITVNKYRDYEFAQVCAGGIPAKEVNTDTFASVYVDNLYFAGELLNVDGICGGYNLHFAWGSGLVAATNACK